LSAHRDFWRSSGFDLLRRDGSGHLAVTDDFLRAYLIRPEMLPTGDSCAAEIALHEALLAEPRQPVDAARLTALADEDARDNYRIVLRFRDRLVAGGTLEAAYLGLFRGSGIDLPPLFVDHLVHAILRNLLDGASDPYRLRAAELLFRAQRVSLDEGAVMLADEETVEQRAADDGAPSLVRLAAVYRGLPARDDTLAHILALFRLTFIARAAMRSDLAGQPVYLGLAMTPDRRLRLKPQNLLTNLPLASPKP